MTRSECDISKPFFKSETDPYAHIERQIEELVAASMFDSTGTYECYVKTMRQMLEVVRTAKVYRLMTDHLGGGGQSELDKALAKLTDSQPTEK